MNSVAAEDHPAQERVARARRHRHEVTRRPVVADRPGRDDGHHHQRDRDERGPRHCDRLAAPPCRPDDEQQGDDEERRIRKDHSLRERRQTGDGAEQGAVQHRSIEVVADGAPHHQGEEERQERLHVQAWDVPQQQGVEGAEKPGDQAGSLVVQPSPEIEREQCRPREEQAMDEQRGPI